MSEKMITVILSLPEYNGLTRFLKQRKYDIEADEEDLGLLLPLLNAYESRVLWTEISGEKA